MYNACMELSKDLVAASAGPLILSILQRGESYGYAIVQRVRELSGGQWQKIALSRAFMRTRADILVLDEPTAAMDAQAEAEVFEHFRQLARDRITILISHRFSTVRMADQIVVLNRGCIVERGTHEELMRLNGHYAQLFTLQARGYR